MTFILYQSHVVTLTPSRLEGKRGLKKEECNVAYNFDSTGFSKIAVIGGALTL